MTRNELCAHCESFSLKDSPQATDGIGRCSVQWEPSINPLMRWDAAPCVLFGKAPDMAKRTQFIQMRRREEGGNAAAA
jgi:hypothetical protein